MSKSEALAKFRKADELYRTGQYTDALAILDELDEQFPKQKNVLLPKARCLYHLNQLDEAQRLSEFVVQKFGDQKAVKLLERIRVAKAGGDEMPPLPPDDDMPSLRLNDESGYLATPDFDALGAAGATVDPLKVEIADGFTSEKLKKPAVIEVEPDRNWAKIGGIAAGVVIVLGILCMPLYMSTKERPAPTNLEVQPSTENVDEMPVWGIKADEEFLFGALVYRGYTFTWWGWAIFFLVFVWIQFGISLAAILAIFGRMPHETMSENASAIATASFICAVPFGIVCVLKGRILFLPIAMLFGIVRAVMLLRNRFDFGFGEIALYLFFAAVTIGAFWGSFIYLYVSTLFASAA
jgi:hypothetical protein